MLGQRPYDVQVVGGRGPPPGKGRRDEDRTRARPWSPPCPAYLNALGGQGVHLVTVNDYLAARDAEWMGTVHRFLGLEVGLIQNSMPSAERRPAYRGGHHLWDQQRVRLRLPAGQHVDGPCQHGPARGHHYAIVDEVDSILIDEARTPLIISGRVADSAKWYRDFARIAARLHRNIHYEVDEGKRQVLTTEEGRGAGGADTGGGEPLRSRRGRLRPLPGDWPCGPRSFTTGTRSTFCTGGR